MSLYLGLSDVAAGHPEAEKELAEIRALLAEWLKFASDVQPGCAAGADWLDGLRHKTGKYVPPNDASNRRRPETQTEPQRLPASGSLTG